MRPVDAVEVSPGAPTVLQPGGLHIMLTGLKQPLGVPVMAMADGMQHHPGQEQQPATN